MSHFVLFDVWTRGVHHYANFFDSALKLNHKVSVLHYSSLEDPSYHDHHHKYPFICFIDMSTYNYSIEDAIAHQQPDVALFLSIDPLIMRSISLSLSRKNIPKVVLYPGLWSTQNLTSSHSILQGFSSLLRKISTRSSQYIFALKHYLKQIVLSQSRLLLVLNLIRVEFHKLLTKFPTHSLDYVVDLVFVYNNLDKRHAQFKFPSASHVVCGYPELSRFNLTPSKSLPFYFTSVGNNLTILYIGSGPNSRRGILSDLSSYYNYLCKLSAYFSSRNISFIIRPHYSLYDQLVSMNNQGLILDNSSNLEALFLSIDLVISEPSTLSICALYKSIPILGVRLFELEKLSYGPVFHDNILFREIFSLSSLPTLLTYYRSLSHSELRTNHESSFVNIDSNALLCSSIFSLLAPNTV